MKAVVKEQPAPGVAVLDVPDPEPGPDEVLVRVDTAGICGSDLHAYEWIPEYRWLEPHLPFVLGHELTGRVAAAPDNEGLVDARVAIRPAVTCGVCESCERGQSQRCPRRVRIGYERDGGLATYVAAPAANAYQLPETLDRDSASLMEPLTVAVHALSDLHLDLSVPTAVLGVGAIGLLSVQLLLARGAADVMLVGTPADEAGGGLSVGESLGAHAHVAGSDEVERLAGTREVVVVAAGAPAAVQSALRLARPGGRVVTVGLGIGETAVDVDATVRRELSLTGSFGSVPRDWLDARDLLASGQVVGDGIVSHHVPLSDAVDAFRLLEAGEARKVCVLPW